MITDISTSSELVKKLGKTELNDIEFGIMVLSTGAWPSLTVKCLIPKEMSQCATEFEKFYSDQNRNR